MTPRPEFAYIGYEAVSYHRHLERITMADPSSLTADPATTEPIVASFEVLDKSTGRTTVMGKWRARRAKVSPEWKRVGH